MTFRKNGSDFERLSHCGNVWLPTAMTVAAVMIEVSLNGSVVVDSNLNVVDLFA